MTNEKIDFERIEIPCAQVKGDYLEVEPIHNNAPGLLYIGVIMQSSDYDGTGVLLDRESVRALRDKLTEVLNAVH